MTLLANFVSMSGQERGRFLGGERIAPPHPHGRDKSGPYTRAMNCHKEPAYWFLPPEKYMLFLCDK
jgi:hypothetical protein